MSGTDENAINSANENYMLRALELAAFGTGHTLPNPVVGAVIVKDGRIIGEGYHRAYGGLHAERNALASVSDDPSGADMYVTLEPCDHHGKTPPCTEAIIGSGIKRVFIGSPDPNPKVRGKGIEHLRREGIEVVTDVLRGKCDDLNRLFFRHIQTGLPYVCMKYAMTADGKTATKTGGSKWISNEESRGIVHEMRREYPAIMAGVNTVIEDDPMLNCRLKNGMMNGPVYAYPPVSEDDRNAIALSCAGNPGKDYTAETVHPVRIICDSSLRLPKDCNIVKTAKDIPAFAACAIPGLPEGILVKAGLDEKNADVYQLRYPGLVTSMSDDKRAEDKVFEQGDQKKEDDKELSVSRDVLKRLQILKDSGVGIINTSCKGKTDLGKLAGILGGAGIAGILLEGGGTLNYSALEAGIVNEVYMFIGSKIFGGTAKTPVMGEGVELVHEAFDLRLQTVTPAGDDVMVRYAVE